MNDLPLSGPRVRTLVVHPYLKHDTGRGRSPGARLEEAVGLAHAIDLGIELTELAPLTAVRPATYLGKGRVEELAEKIAGSEIALAVMDTALSPVQQCNLEKAWDCKVIDRTALILEIFGARARTNEGKLQVELASLEYQKGRLVRSWTHLERQRGGFGFLGGPGETQIETDRRMIRDRIAKITASLAAVTRTRALHRKVREAAPYPVVALVGYTNAGKSTLFNRLTDADVFAENLLFATLDPTLRRLRLPSGLSVMLSDTVGFISDLPTELVAAFRATLEEVLGADLLLHVRDVSHPDSDAQKRDVETVLASLFGEEESWHARMLEVLNKTDLLPAGLLPPRAGDMPGMPISALTGDGIADLLAHIDATLSDRFLTTICARLPLGDGKRMAWLHAHGRIVADEMDEDSRYLTVRLSEGDAGRFQTLEPLSG